MRFVVPRTVRVRREAFGLLFYDTRTTNLTFVRSGTKLVPSEATGPGERGSAAIDVDESQAGAISGVLETLRAKGLVVADDPAD